MGLILGLLAFGFVALVAAGGAAWYFFLRPKPVETGQAEPATGPQASGGAAGGTAAATVPDSGPSPTPGQPAAGEGPAPFRGEGSARAADAGGSTTGRPYGPGTAPAETRAPARTPSAGEEGGQAGRVPPQRSDGGAQREPAAPDASFLDDEPAPSDPNAGARVAEAYRNRQGGGPYGSSPYGAGGRFRPRPLSPTELRPIERPAVATLRHVINAEEAFRRKHGRYGTFEELRHAQALYLDVPLETHGFLRKAYRFSLTVKDNGEGFEVRALPTGVGLRPFVGDDTQFIRAGLE